MQILRTDRVYHFSFCSYFPRRIMGREVFQVSLREIHTRFTTDKLTRESKDEELENTRETPDAFRIDKAIRFRASFCFSVKKEKDECT